MKTDLNLQRVEELVARHYIRRARHPTLPFTIYNYTERAQYQRVWTPETRGCRGLILDDDATIVARPWDKFFGLNEMPETRLEALPDGPIEVTVKEDGSLGILYRTPDGYAIATRGSFTGKQAVWATEYLQANYDLAGLPDEITLLFEIIYPENRVVLDYGGREALILLGARRFDGYDLPRAEVAPFAARYGFPLVPEVTAHGLEDLLEQASIVKGVEGWVLRFPNGLRVKLKTEDYVTLHRVIFGLTPERVREALLADWTAFLTQIPEELRPEVEAQARQITDAVEAMETRVLAAFAATQAAVAGDPSRKAFALHVMAHYPEERPYLFKLLDGRPIREDILKNLDLRALLGPVAPLELTPRE